MSELAERDRVAKRGWAAPGGFHDMFVRALKIVLPLIVVGFLGYLLISPLSKSKEASFLLDKTKVESAHERLKTQSAQYRGTDDQGRGFTVVANRALQATSSVPIVDVNGMSAQIQLKDGPAVMTADHGRYHMDQQKMDVPGQIRVNAANGYRLDTRNVSIDLNNHSIAGSNGVEGQMPLGHFSASTLAASIADRSVTLGGRAHLHIVQGGIKRKKK